MKTSSRGLVLGRVITLTVAIALTVALATALTACGQNGPGTTAGRTDTSAGTTVGKVKVGVIMPFSGVLVYCGIQAKAGIEMAQDALGSDSRIQLVYEDDLFIPRAAVTAYQKLVQQDGVKFIIGSCNSSATLALAPLAEQDHTLLVTPASGADKISQAGEYTFRTATSTKLEVERMANFIASQGWKKVAIYYLNNDYGMSVRENLEKELKFYGGKIVLAEPINTGDVDHKSKIVKVKNTAADVIVSAQTAETAATFYRQKTDLRINLPIVSIRTLERSDLVDAAGNDAVEGTFIISSTTWAPPHFQEQMAAKLKSMAMSTHIERFLPLETAGGYDALLAINDAIKKCGTDTVCAKDWLVSPDYFNDDGAMGRLRFDNYGDAVRYTIVKVFKNGDLIPYDDTPKTTKDAK